MRQLAALIALAPLAFSACDEPSEVTVTVDDGRGGAASVSFPIHVTERL